MKNQVHGDMLHTITQINALRSVIAHLEAFDQSGITAIYNLTATGYDADYATMADKYDTLTKETLETLRDRLSKLEKSLIIDRTALMNSPVYHRTLEEKQKRFYYWMRQATLAGNVQFGMHRDSARTKQLWRIARKAESFYRKAQ